MKRLTREQKKIYAVFAVIVISLLVFFVFIYMPESRRLMEMKNKLKNAENQIEEITKISQGKDLIEMVGNLNTQLGVILSRLPQKPEDIIDDLADNAKKLGVETKNISFSPKIPVTEEVKGYEIVELPIDISLVGEYRAVGEYIRALHSDEFPVVIKVGQINIKGKGEGRPQLEAALHIVAYLEK